MQTGGAIPTGGATGEDNLCGVDRGGAEKTGVAVLIVTGGAIPRQAGLNERIGT